MWPYARRQPDQSLADWSHFLCDEVLVLFLDELFSSCELMINHGYPG